MVCGIYAIFDTCTHDCLYVGQSHDIESRWKQHIKGLRYGIHKRKEFISWFIKHGEDLHSIEFSILEECANEDSIKNFHEAKWFVILKPKFYGKIPSLKEEWSLSLDTRNKISRSLRSNFDKKKIACHKCGHKFIPKNCVEIVCKRCLTDYYREQNTVIKKTEIPEIVDLYNRGKSLREISSIYHVSHICIRNILLKNDVSLHSYGYVSKKQIQAADMSRVHSRNIICVVCGKEFFDKNTRRKTCSQQCHHELVSRNAKNNHVNSNRISKSCKAFMESKNLSYDESINLIIHMYSIEKMSINGLNKETGLSKNFIHRVLQDNNVSIVHSKEKNILSDDVKKSIQHDYKNHIDINSLKRKYHLSYRKIRDCLNS